MLLRDLIDQTGLEVKGWVGVGNPKIGRVWNYSEAQQGDITFWANETQPERETHASAVIVAPETELPWSYSTAVPRTLEIIHHRPRYAIMRVARVLYPDENPHGPLTLNIHPTVSVGPGTAIGHTGFGYEWDGTQTGWVRLPHIGGVTIRKGVEIGANCTIDRGTFSDTTIGEGTKLDDGVHVAHNCRVGAHCMLTAHVMLAGGVTLGEGTWVGPGAQIAEGVTVGAGATIGIGAVVLNDVAAGATVVGNPAKEIPTKRHQRGVTRP